MSERKPITDEDLFFGELETALRALTRAREIADDAPGDTRVDEAWDAVVDLEHKTRELLEVFGSKPRNESSALHLEDAWASS